MSSSFSEISIRMNFEEKDLRHELNTLPKPFLITPIINDSNYITNKIINNNKKIENKTTNINNLKN
jgi:hypothetical protein